MSHRRSLLVTLACLVPSLALLLPGVAGAQNDGLTIDGVNDDDDPEIEVVVTVPAALEDFRLPKEAFAITENGEPRPQPRLGNAPDTGPSEPPRVVLAIDVSGSMSEPIGSARAAAESFVRSLPPRSEVAVVTFGQTVDVALDFTPDVERARTAIRGITVADRQAETALYDGVIRAAELLPPGADATSSIVLLSDGKDTISDITKDEAVRRLRRREAVLWAVDLVGSERDPEALRALAGDTGEVLPAEDAGELDGIYRGLASDLKRRYLLRFESEASGSTDIGVSVDHAGHRAHASTTVEITGTPAGAADAPAPVAPPTVHTVTLPVLGTTAAYVVGLAAVAIGSLLFWLLVLAPRSRTRERLLADQAHRERPRMSSIAAWTTEVAERSLRDRKLGRGLDRYLEGAGLDFRPGEVAVIVVSGMVVAFALGMVAAGPLLGVLLAAMPPIITRLVLSIRRDRRHAAFSEQLTDVMQLLGGSLRAGYGLMQGIDAIARDAEEPSAGEFRRILIEHRLGRDLNDAMLSCAERMDNDDFKWVVQAIAIHRDVGGNLARVLDNITTTVRDRGEVHRQVRTLSAEGRMSAYVLTGLPLIVLIGLRILNPDYMDALTGRPIGWILLAVSSLLLLTGVVWIRRLARIRY
jgi:tight adherence protein B